MQTPPIPALAFQADVLLRAQSVRLVIFDVDGVLTDGGLHFNDAGESLKRFHVLDGQGFKLLHRVGIHIAVITGRDSAAVRTRVQALGVQHAMYGVQNKLPAAEKILNQLQIGWHQTAVMGDDWPDLPLQKRCGLACTPPNGHAENLNLAHYTTSRAGGQGAARELCDLVLVAKGLYADLLAQEMQA